MSAGLGAPQATSAPGVAQVLLQQFLQLALVLLTLRLSGEVEARLQVRTDGQRATLFSDLTFTIQTFLLFQLPLCVLLWKRERVSDS